MGSSTLQKLNHIQTKTAQSSLSNSRMGEKRYSNTIEVIKTMNLAARKLNQKRIEEDNAKIAKKIYNIDPYLKHSEQI